MIHHLILLFGFSTAESSRRETLGCDPAESENTADGTNIARGGGRGGRIGPRYRVCSTARH